MKFIRLAGVCLVVGIVCGGSGVSSAGAVCLGVDEPETGFHEDSRCRDVPAANGSHIFTFSHGKKLWKAETTYNIFCAKVKFLLNEPGEFPSNECRETEFGFEWIKVRVPLPRPPVNLPGPGILMLGRSGTAKLVATGTTITCAKSTAPRGETISDTTVGGMVITFTGCKANKGGEECTVKSTGAAAGSVITKTLKGELGTVKSAEAASEAGLLLSPETGSEITTLEKATCSAETKVTGSVAAEVTPVNKELTSSKFVFVGTGKSEKIKTIAADNGSVKKPLLEAFGGDAAEELSAEITWEEELEIEHT
jgi:hypothetical protein